MADAFKTNKKARKKTVALARRLRIPSIRTTRFVLRGKDIHGLFEQEVRNAEITGLLQESRTAPACNIIETILISFTAES
ncbi:MAG: hypothetical protein ACJ71U_23285, partial [Terriglobales bacterium]